MSNHELFSNKRDFRGIAIIIKEVVEGVAEIIWSIIYYIFPIIILSGFVIIIFNINPKISFQICSVQTGYILAISLLTFGMLGLWFENASLFQQQAFKLLVWAGVLLLILTFCFSMAIDILALAKK
ncbi:MAG: hypothetical protein Q7O12_03160 [Deltaproteobacteria bacterium]|nr:hypothetical protein [Deltaproteobacteria bacterium]